MRSLLLLQWCFLFLLTALSVGSSALPLPDCNWKMPIDHAKCQQTITYQVHDDKQALATCLEHFATTFIDAKRDESDTSKIICIVYRQYQCNFMPGAVSMFDKCYMFHPELGEITMNEYLKVNRATYCKDKYGDGGIPVFYTMTQAKHIAMEAHRRGISKIWVNVDKNGKTIETQISKSESGHFIGYGHSQGFLINKDQWKLHKANYWKGKELKSTPMLNNEFTVPPTEKADYLFFRSKNDHWNKLFQGSFERATIDSTAGIVCEFEPDNIKAPPLERFCGKMQKMGINAIYTEDSYSKRCLYTTLTQYSMNGGSCRDFKWGIQARWGKDAGQEMTSDPDDGSAGRLRPIGVPNVYETLTANGTYRVRATKLQDPYGHFPIPKREYCDMRPFSDKENENNRMAYLTYYAGETESAQVSMSSPWEDGYPKNECTDFPTDGTMESNALAIRKGKVIDVPVPVLFPLICSIRSRLDCLQMRYHQLAGLCSEGIEREHGKYCETQDLWNPKIKRYGSCACPKFHFEHEGMCKWVGVNPKINPTSNDHCGAVRHSITKEWMNLGCGVTKFTADWNDHIDKAVVRALCNLRFSSSFDAKTYTDIASELMQEGEHDVPNVDTTTMNGWFEGQAASSADVNCVSKELTLCDGDCAQGPAYEAFVRELAQG